ncbi:MAG: hypothetical protein HYW22_01600 [Candidatus Aenigmarchaeota archaeon]|nr:hypothetical protein [Candidatus Aenigmarchaeota archaeon]
MDYAQNSTRPRSLQAIGSEFQYRDGDSAVILQDCRLLQGYAINSRSLLVGTRKEPEDRLVVIGLADGLQHGTGGPIMIEYVPVGAYADQVRELLKVDDHNVEILG